MYTRDIYAKAGPLSKSIFWAVNAPGPLSKLRSRLLVDVEGRLYSKQQRVELSGLATSACCDFETVRPLTVLCVC